MIRADELELSVEGAFIKAVEAEGWLQRKLTYPGRRGAPDRIVYARHPVVVLAELKRFGETPSPLQRVEHADLMGLGHRVWVIDRRELIPAFVAHVKDLERRYAP